MVLLCELCRGYIMYRRRAVWEDIAASLLVLVFEMLFCRSTFLPKSPPAVRHRDMRLASCSSSSTTSHTPQVHSYPPHGPIHLHWILPRSCPPTRQVCLVLPLFPLVFSYSSHRLRLILPHLRSDSRSARPTTTRLFKRPRAPSGSFVFSVPSFDHSSATSPCSVRLYLVLLVTIVLFPPTVMTQS